MVRRMGYVLTVAALALSAPSLLAQHDHGAHGAAPHAQSAQPAAPGDPYLLPTDPVTGEKLGQTPVIINYQGRELRFANQENANRFQADPKAYLPKIDQQMIEQQKPFYPLNTCIVSGEKLDGMGGAVDILHHNRLVRLCYTGCQKDFQKDPATFLKKLDQAVIKAQKPGYPLKECPVSGQALGAMGEPVDYVVGNRLVRLCCGGCIEAVKKNPTAALQKLSAPSNTPAPQGAGHADHAHH